jgi:hypothetical protein
VALNRGDDLTLILILKELWRRRILVLVAVVLAAAISVFAIYDVSFSPPSISKRAQVNAQGSIEILVDSSHSPIADVGRELTPLTDRAAVFARYIAGGNVIARISKETDIPINQIDVAGPAPLPGEAPGAGEAAPQLRPYGIAIAQRGTLPIVSVSTRAPTVQEARNLAAAAPEAVRRVVKSIQDRQRIPSGDRVEFRALGPAQAAIAADALGAKVTLALFMFLLGMFIVLILGIPRFVVAWKTAEPVDLPGSPPQVEMPSLQPVPSKPGASQSLALPPEPRERSGSGT